MNNYISDEIKESIIKSSWIRKMFEKGNELKSKFGAENVFDFSLGNPDVPPPEKFFIEYKKKASEINYKNHSYMPNAGYDFLRDKLAVKLQKEYKHKEISKNNIIMTVGAAGALNVILKTLLNPDDEVIIISPFFVEYCFYINNHRGKTIIVNSKENFDLDVNEIEKNITDKTKAIILNSPNNPTGKIYSKENIKELSDLLKKKKSDIFIISDEPYKNIVYDNVEVPSILNYYENTIIANSFSKELSLPGERIGYILINPDCKGKSEIFNGLVLCNRILGFVNAPATMQRVLTDILDSSVDTEIYKRRRDLLYNFLKEEKIDIIKPDGAFYLFPKSPIKNDIEFVNHLQKYNILVVPGTGFGKPGYFRISYCISETIIKNSFTNFHKALNDL